ncbi:LBP / BPI / CETP family protein [Ancylostoma ceylanicum]|uniref:LBP / BPI / CETP family protein n=1 Tax=Ancylostoma ceylanicum TaxID=53326 RepID=A0A0D6M1M3_9BILA|nr:LBP / BPI / CETP family protein [Ancylostoma ceylanicum]
MRIRLLLAVLAGFVESQNLANGLFAETGSNAGFVSRINQKGFDLMANYLGERVKRFLGAGELIFNISAAVSPEVRKIHYRQQPMRITLTSIRVTDFDAVSFASKMIVISGKGIAWRGSNLNVTVLTSFHLNTPSGELTGSSPLSFDRTNVELLLWTGVNADGHLKTDLVTCKVAANNVELTLAAADKSIANYLPVIMHFIKERIEQAICPSFHAELVPVVSNRLMNTPMSAALFEHFFVNYGLLSPVEYTDTRVAMRHRGNAFGILRQGRTRLNDFRLPFRAPPLNEGPSSDKMVDFILSNYTMTSLLFWMDQYRKFDYEISRTAQNNTAIAGYLKTDCPGDDICAGTLFPALGQRFPGGEVIIKSHTISYPRMTINDGNATIYIDSRVDAFVQRKKIQYVPKIRKYFVKEACCLSSSCKLVAFRNYVLHADMHIERFKIREVASLVDGIDEGSLEFLVNALTELILNEDMAKKLKGGIHLPIIFDFEQSSSEVVFEKDRIRISADYCYGDSCRTATVAESKDNAIDYYDVVQG